MKSALDWIRTSTPLREPPPQDGESTNFSTRAFLILWRRKDIFFISNTSYFFKETVTIHQIYQFPYVLSW